MTLTLLLDLDDTLITSKMETTFQEAYLKALADHLINSFDSKSFIRKLLAATQAMIENDRPDRTLEEVFDAIFYPSLGVQKEELTGSIQTFYREVFPTLKPLTAARPQAVKLVEEAFKDRHRLVVATNPLFPLTAITQRLEWAELSPQRYHFDLIPSYETFHFAKPNPAYYSELISQLGCPNGPVIMVGNDLEMDILPSALLGIRTFYIKNREEVTSTPQVSPNGQGTFDDLTHWLSRIGPNDVQPPANAPRAIIAMLKAAPAALSTILREVPEVWWSQRPEENEWSLTEIVCHLRDVEIEVNIPRLQLVATEENPFVAGMVTDPWAEERQYNLQDGPEAFKSWMQARLSTIDILTSFKTEDWDRLTRHAIFGPTPVRELMGFITTHDRSHQQQINQTLKIITV